ncbi:MAG: hypothetical protein A3A29_01800 [Candidatus Ryanbacteria bacterium RIFCSPLOWO2_01_FULL_47_79]|uniref:Uncharacterized protein n=1 Tax=Candidatus Yanofskybacteria bacterium RIFCSPLOWO2_02_FULL_45_10 TaxID=1802706 RepID=A0A1F8H5A2_9BACT|nr:MAG: hypothetical protein A3I32_00810 [Candidatus Yanofskybacteria bacterium RIFCSPLOWO2_02_FULL_45_10]OGZ52711.1 MAG: hypothetical protein A3A29_01800 [Candidatus Ryanbacteria bacterium RIFCSPLOWO2_01_FULL_47_79]
MRRSKYSYKNLLPMFRKAAALRNEMLDVGFTDNGGAIHSAERILDILGMRLKYPGLSHVNNLKNYSKAEFSPAAYKIHRRGRKVLIEHVSPRRALTRVAIKKVKDHATDKELLAFLKRNYRLVLLTTHETALLNKQNRIRIDRNRLKKARIRIMRYRSPK